MKSKLLQLFCLTTIIISSLSLLQYSSASESEVGDETPFTYKQGTDKGPENWGKLNPNWEICSSGKLQSPIDILHQRVQNLPTLGLRRDYQPAFAVLKNRGHDIMVEWTGDAGKLHINGDDYRLVQCHWHSPSEHRFNGSRYHLEVHLVHKNAKGQTAVVAVVYKYGHPDSFLSKLLPHIKSAAGSGGKKLGRVNPGDIKFGNRKYYEYIGSLTVPPCTEGVIWTITKKVRTVSMEQVRALREAVHDGFEENARPVQALNGRAVTLYIPIAYT